jgi:hypothetical protein
MGDGRLVIWVFQSQITNHKSQMLNAQSSPGQHCGQGPGQRPGGGPFIGDWRFAIGDLPVTHRRFVTEDERLFNRKSQIRNHKC